MFDAKALEPIRTKGVAYWPPALVETVLDTVAAIPGVYELRTEWVGTFRIPRSSWWRAFLLVARDTGLPRSDIEDIRRTQIAPNGVCALTIENRDRVFRLKPDTIAAMPEQARPFKFPGCDKTFAKHWRLTARLARLPDEMFPTPKTFFASRQVPAQVPAQTQQTETTEPPKNLLDFFTRFYLPMRLCGKSPRTRILYETSIRKFEDHLSRDALLEDFSDTTVGAYLSNLLTNKKPASVEKERNQLLAMWRLACAYHFVEFPPNIPAIPVPKRDPVAWLEHELKALFEAIDNMKGFIVTIPEKLW